MAYLTLTNFEPEEWSFRVRSGSVVIGRSRHSDIRLPVRYSTVSRRHAELTTDTAGSVLRDLGSRAGTRVNGVWIDNGKKVRVAVGDRLWMGGAEINIVAQVSQVAQILEEVSGFDEDAETFIQRKYSRSWTRQLLDRLSPTELDLMLWICRGHTSDDELSKFLSRSPNTVRTQIASIMQKLELHSRAEVVTWLQRSSRNDGEIQHLESATAVGIPVRNGRQ